MSSTTMCQISNYSPLPKKLSIDHSNPALSRLQGQSAQVTSPWRIESSPTNTSGEGDSTTKTEARINEVIPVEQTSNNQEQCIVQKLKEALKVQPDQTIRLTFDNIDLYNFPEVERLLEESRVRVDYNSSTCSLTIKMASQPHECGARGIRGIFEPRMRALQSKYGRFWKYNTNGRVRIQETEEDIVAPTTFEKTPDGAISDASGLLLPVEISTSQTREEAVQSIRTFFNNPSVIAGIVLNMDEAPKYASPKNAKGWHSAEDYVSLMEWEGVGLEPWEPIMFAGHCWGGAISCQIEVHWPSVRGDVLFTASIVPPSPAKAFAVIKSELNEIWRTLVQVHFRGQVDEGLDEDLNFDVESFSHELWMDVREGAHERYSDAWAKLHNKKPSIRPSMSDRRERRLRRIAAQNRKVALLQEGQTRSDRGAEGNKREADGTQRLSN